MYTNRCSIEYCLIKYRMLCDQLRVVCGATSNNHANWQGANICHVLDLAQTLSTTRLIKKSRSAESLRNFRERKLQYLCITVRTSQIPSTVLFRGISSFKPTHLSPWYVNLFCNIERTIRNYHFQSFKQAVALSAIQSS